jgi:hypothetical protein
MEITSQFALVIFAAPPFRGRIWPFSRSQRWALPAQGYYECEEDSVIDIAGDLTCVQEPYEI